MPGSWSIRSQLKPDASLRLFCFPYAGIGASAYRLWPVLLPSRVEMVAVQPPGRENRLGEPAITEMRILVERIATEIAPLLDRRFAFFGHSMGAAVAFEVARQLRAMALPVPDVLFLSGRRAPQLPNPEPLLHPLPDDEFIAEVQRRYNGIPREVLAHRELLALLLPGLRTDIRALERHVFASEPPLDAPIHAFGGAEDPLVTRPELEAWETQTRHGAQVRQFPGEHFYLGAQRESLVGVIVAALAPYAERRAVVGGPS